MVIHNNEIPQHCDIEKLTLNPDAIMHQHASHIARDPSLTLPSWQLSRLPSLSFTNELITGAF